MRTEHCRPNLCSRRNQPQFWEGALRARAKTICFRIVPSASISFSPLHLTQVSSQLRLMQGERGGGGRGGSSVLLIETIGPQCCETSFTEDGGGLFAYSSPICAAYMRHMRHMRRPRARVSDPSKAESEITCIGLLSFLGPPSTRGVHWRSDACPPRV